MNASKLEFDTGQISSFQIKMHINSFLALSADSFGVYLIVCKASKAMGAYKWFLLNIVVTSMLFDIYITLLLVPFPLNPALGYCSTGLLQYLGLFWGAAIPFVLLMQFLGLTGAAVINAAIYRLAAVYNVHRKLTRTSSIVCLGVVQILFALPTVVFGTLVAVQITEDQQNIIEGVLQDYPRLEKVLESELCIFMSFSSDYPWLTWVVISAMLELVGCVVLGSIIWTVSLLHLKKRKREMSRRSYQLHRQLIFSLAMQFAIPGLTLVLPFLLVTLFVIFQPVNIEGGGLCLSLVKLFIAWR